VMSKERFEAELSEGHEGVTTVIIPFDAEDVWQLKRVKLDPRRDGWLVKGTLNRTRFDGYNGYGAGVTGPFVAPLPTQAPLTYA
jgi:hypothetical protein